VNQQQQVAEEVAAYGRRFHYGFEVGSKPELIAALAYLKDPENPNQLVPEVPVDENTPPCFLVVGHQDSSFVEGSALFYLAMQRAKRPCELHIFAKGGHGFGIKDIPQRIGGWPKLAGNWMNEMNFLSPTAK
jgi:acetyl esterase/lipase